MRADRCTVEYMCDQCGDVRLVYVGWSPPFDESSFKPGGWFSVWRGSNDVHLCSEKCLLDYAVKLVTASSDKQTKERR